MDDELESLLREHYGRSAQAIHPDPGLAGRLRSAGRPRRRFRLAGRLALALAAAVAVVVGGLAWAGFRGGGERAEPAAVQARPVAITISGRQIPGAGLEEELTGSTSPGGTVGLSVEFRRSSGWGTGATVTAVAGHYRTTVGIADDTTALRVCTQATPITCSSPLFLPRRVPSPIAGTPSSAPRPYPVPVRTPSVPRILSRTPSPTISPH